MVHPRGREQGRCVVHRGLVQIQRVEYNSSVILWRVQVVGIDTFILLFFFTSNQEHAPLNRYTILHGH
jgi:hypothetical protein